MLKPLPEAARDISAMRDGAGVHVIQIVPADPRSGLLFNCQQASFSGELAKNFSEAQVLGALCDCLQITLQYYRRLLAEAVLLHPPPNSGTMK